MSILDHPIISERYFFPRQDAVANPTWIDVDGARLACHAHRAGHDLTVVHFHGNGEVAADYVPDFVDTLDFLGADVFLAEYRGYGESTGVPKLGKMLDDVEAIFDAVDRPSGEIIVFGRSVGSIYAVEMAHRFPGVAGLVLESGIADPFERILLRATPAELRVNKAQMKQAFDERLDQLTKLSERSLPTLVIHARHDALVDVTHAVRLAAAPADNVRLVVFQEGNHNTIFHLNRRQYLKELEEMFEMIRRGGSYGIGVDKQPMITGESSVDDTMEGGFDVPEVTAEYDSPADLRPRSGPGETEELDVPDVLRSISKPDSQDDTFEMAAPPTHED